MAKYSGLILGKFLLRPFGGKLFTEFLMFLLIYTKLPVHNKVIRFTSVK